MKRLTLIVAVFSISAISVFGQKPVTKPKLMKAETLLRNGDVEQAKAHVDLAVVDEKLKTNVKSFHLRAAVYAKIDTAASFQGLADNAMEVVLESFAVATEMSKDDKAEPTLMDALSFPVPLSQHKQGYWAYYFNKAAIAFGESDFQTAMDNFLKSQMIQPEDTNGYINAALAAQNLEQFDISRENYYKAIEAGATSKDIWNLLIFIVGSVDKNPEEALRLTREIKERFPTDSDIARSEISLLIELEKIEEAEANLLAELEKGSDDPNMFFTLAILNDEIGQASDDPEVKAERKEKAMAAYRKAMEVDPSHYSSNYNVGVILIESANEVIKESNNLGVSAADLKKTEELAPIIDERLMAALPQWEKINEIQADDIPTLETLHYLYSQLKKYDRAEEILTQIEELGGREEE